MARLHSERASVNAELKELSELLENERQRLTDSLRVALGLVEKTLTPSKEMAKRRPAPASPPKGDEDDIEAQIDEDAAAAAPSLPLLDEDDDDGGRASLAAVPPLEDSGPPTQAWHPESMSIFSSGNDTFLGTEADSGQHRLGPLGSDWIA
jgi:hypothetical protein